MLNNILDKIGKKRLRMIIVVIIVSIILFIFLYNKITKEESSVFIPNLTPAPSPSTLSGLKSNNSFYLNRINAIQSEVTGYSWTENTICYSTPDGIYIPNTTTPLLEENIIYNSWSNNGRVVFQTNDGWFWFNCETKEIFPLNSNTSRAWINKNGTNIIIQTPTSLNIVDLENNNKAEKTNEDEIISLTASLGNNFGVLIKKNDAYFIKTYNYKLEEEYFYVLTGEAKLLDISPSGEEILIADSNKSTITIHSLSSQKDIVFLTQENSISIAQWINKDIIFLTETTTDELGRQIDYFSFVNNKGEREYLTNSMPMINKLNNEIRLVPNKDITAIALPEKNMGMWILSFKPGNIPDYSDEGVYFFSTKAQQKEF